MENVKPGKIEKESGTLRSHVPIHNRRLVKLHFPNVSDLQMLGTDFEVTSEIVC